MTKNLSLYIHIPFCESKCIYCAFSSFVPQSEQIENYFRVLNKEIEKKAKQCTGHIVKTIFFGGGTPSVVDPKFITKTLSTIKQHFVVDEGAEISIECNPNSATYQKLQAYFDAGFNRVSFGVQSLCDDELQFLNRRHDRACAMRAIKDAKEIGFKNINADLLIGLKTQTQQTYEAQINDLVSAGVTHISSYMLMIENNTPLKKMRNKQKYLMSDDECVDLYEHVVAVLKQKGFERYEISNFAPRGFECKHNLVYWNGGEYLGMGLAAHSYFDGKRIANTTNFDRFLSQTRCQKTHVVSRKEQKEEFVMLALRTREGIDLKQYLRLFGSDLLKDKKTEIEEIKDFVEIRDNHLKIKESEFGKSNLIILKLI